MYLDQHSIESLGTARLLSRNAADYEYFLEQLLGRKFVLAQPVEVRGTVRLKARFVSDKKASGEQNAPYIDLWVEFNPAMGLYTVWGEYWQKEGNEQPIFKSSPRSGYDDEMLADPSRLFDWLVAYAKGQPSYASEIEMEAVAEALADMTTPAGEIEEVVVDEVDGVMAIRLAPEYRMPLDYYVSGTHFGGPRNDTDLIAKNLTFDDWQMNYEQPVKAAVLKTLDSLYGFATFDVDVDEDGFVYVMNLIPALKQESKMTPKSTSKLSAFEAEILRMAGVDGRERLDDRRLTEKYKADPDADKLVGQPKKKKSPPADKFQMMVKDGDNLAKFKGLVAKLKKQKGVKDPEALAAWIGLRVAGSRSHGKKEESILDAMQALLDESAND